MISGVHWSPGPAHFNVVGLRCCHLKKRTIARSGLSIIIFIFSHTYICMQLPQNGFFRNSLHAFLRDGWSKRKWINFINQIILRYSSNTWRRKRRIIIIKMECSLSMDEENVMKKIYMYYKWRCIVFFSLFFRLLNSILFIGSHMSKILITSSAFSFKMIHHIYIYKDYY